MTSIGNKGVFQLQQEIVKFLKSYASRPSLFRDKKVFQPAYKPSSILHRDELIGKIAKTLAPILKYEKPSNVFIYGKTGSGKTLSVKTVIDGLNKVAEADNLPLKIIYANCKLKRVADTEYRLIAQLSNELGKPIPPTGLPTDEVYKIFYNAVEESEKAVLLVLDEIDQLTKKTGSDALYNLTRINEELSKSFISLTGISNDLNFRDELDSRVRSSLSEEQIVFPPYDAVQITDILSERSIAGFSENALEPAVIPKCAAYAAHEHGDARRALELLRVAGELADRECSSKVEERHVDEAQDKIDRDMIMDAISSQPKQAKATLFSVLKADTGSKNPIFTGNVYEIYNGVCELTGLRPLTQRRLSEIISELETLGIIRARVISKGRYGRTREIICPRSTNNDKVKKLLQDALGL